ncbi:24751_t:CDS:2 [Gigaspora rosea]|nr:24751_t:CDS:2 [Gigaspora rosea]
MPTVELYNNDDINIAKYFEESFQYNEDINVSNINIEQISLKEANKKSLYYNANQSLIEEVKLLANNEPAIKEDIEDKSDKVTLFAKYFLKILVQSAIKEV